MKHYNEGEYVHIPSGVTAYKLDTEGSVVEYIKSQEPLALMYLGKRDDPHLTGQHLCKVFYEGNVWMILEENVYVMEEKNE